jgi:hypothetical protein
MGICGFFGMDKVVPTEPPRCKAILAILEFEMPFWHLKIQSAQWSGATGKTEFEFEHRPIWGGEFYKPYSGRVPADRALPKPRN